jgi:hypothetical protein
MKLPVLYSEHSGPSSSIHKLVIALAEEGGLSASTAGELYGVLKYTANIMATELPEG